MSEYIEVGQPLQFTDPNTPTRVGEIVENVSDIYNIPSPRLGMQVFVKSEKKSYVITSLKNKVINGVDVPEAAVEAFEPVGAKSITWNNETNPSDMNDFVVAGVYDIKGEHTRMDDNLPILNIGGGHSFNARLTVLDSSISGSGKDDDKCITQVMSFSNRLGQGEVYIRTGKGASLNSLTWEKWSTLQRNVNVGEVGSLDDLKDNGIYSGVWLFGSLNNYPLTFVCVVINDYFIGAAPRRVSQFVYGLSKFDGSVVYQSRVWDDSKDKWSDWEILNQKEISSMITKESERLTAYINSVVADAKRDILEGIDPEKIDSIKDIVAWIDAHGGDVQAIYNAIQGNTVKINEEVSRAEQAEQAINNKLDEEIERSVAADQDLLRRIDEEARRANEAEEAIKNKAVEADSLNFQTRANVVALDYKTIEGVGDEITIPAATAESAGVMSAGDKVSLDSMPNEIEKIKDGDTIVGQAREIHSRNGKTVTDSFLVRTTAGSGTIGDGVASLKSVGGNIVKNLVDGTTIDGWEGVNGNLIYDNSVYIISVNRGYNGGLNVKGKLEYRLYIQGHKYYNSCIAKLSSIEQFDKVIFGVGQITGVSQTNHAAFKPTIDWQLLSYIHTGANINYYNSYMLSDRRDDKSNIYAKNLLCVDLTEMFGAGNEPDQATCDRLFGTMDALPQGLTIANPSEFKSTGFNQFNPNNVLEGKAIVDNAIVSGDKKIAVIPCLPCKVGTGENNGYCIHGEFGDDIKVYLTPLNPMEVDGELYMHELAKDATTDTYVPLIKGYMLVEVPTTANLCAHFLWSEDKCERDTYEPYFESKVELPVIPQMNEWGLAGIQSSGTLACDEIDFERGVYVKRIVDIDLGFAKLVRRGGNDNNVFWLTTGDASFNEAVKSFAICGEYTAVNAETMYYNTGNYDKVIYIGKSGYFSITYTGICIRDSRFTDATALQEHLKGIKAYYYGAEEEYPLPKVDNNYISSDYGVDQFDSVVPCNANNLYYMRSLAGETRNFLDRMYDNTAKADAKEVADYITNGIEENSKKADDAVTLALRKLYIAAGATYNESTGYYTVGDLDDITEEDMAKIYAGKEYINNLDKSKALAGSVKFRTMIPTMSSSVGQVYTLENPINGDTLCSGNHVLEILKMANAQVLSDVQYTSTIPFISSRMNQTFYNCTNLKVIYPIHLSLVNYTNKPFAGCSNLVEVRLYNIKISMSFSDSPLISKDSIIWMLKYAVPTSAITITLHPDAYARLAEDADIVAALAAQPLVTLVSA